MCFVLMHFAQHPIKKHVLYLETPNIQFFTFFPVFIYLFVFYVTFFFSQKNCEFLEGKSRFLAKIWRRPLFILLHFPFSLLSQETSHSWGSSCCDVPPGLYLNLNSSFSPFFSSIAKKLNGKNNLNQLWNKKWFSNFIGGEIMI